MNDKVIQIHTHKVVEGAECSADAACRPFYQAMRRNWIWSRRDVPMGRDGSPHVAMALGDLELGYLSVLNFCPFCGVDLKKVFKNYAPFVEGETYKHEFEGSL